MQSISNVYVSHLILYLCCKFHGNIPNDGQDIANLLLGCFNLSHPVYIKRPVFAQGSAFGVLMMNFYIYNFMKSFIIKSLFSYK